jgi:hypothetical protein
MPCIADAVTSGYFEQSLYCFGESSGNVLHIVFGSITGSFVGMFSCRMSLLSRHLKVWKKVLIFKKKNIKKENIDVWNFTKWRHRNHFLFQCITGSLVVMLSCECFSYLSIWKGFLEEKRNWFWEENADVLNGVIKTNDVRRIISLLNVVQHIPIDSFSMSKYGRQICITYICLTYNTARDIVYTNKIRISVTSFITLHFIAHWNLNHAFVTTYLS